MRPSILVPLVAGLAAGVFALYMLLSAFQEQKEKSAQPTHFATVVVAKQEIPFATKITADMLQEEKVPEPHPFKTAITEMDKAVDRVTALRVAPGMPLLTSVLAAEGTPPGAQHQIPMGMRTVSVEVNAHSVQHLAPGDHVDVLFAAETRQRGMRDMDTILADVEVFSVGDKRPGMGMELVKDDPKTSKKKKKSSQAGARTMRTGGMVAVQLLLTPERAMKLSMAVINGDIKLHSRPFGDTTVMAEADLVVQPAIVQESEVDQQQPVVVEPSKQPEFQVVKVLQGGEESEAKFQVGDAPAEAPQQGNGTKPSSPRASNAQGGFVPDLIERAERSDKKDIGE